MTGIDNPPGLPVVADTHALLWYVTAPEKLSSPAVKALEGAVEVGSPIVVSAVSLIELVYAADKRSDRIDSETLDRMFGMLDSPDSPLAIAAVTTRIAHEMASISRTQVRDPFDRAIVATARSAGLRLISCDIILTRHFLELCLW